MVRSHWQDIQMVKDLCLQYARNSELSIKRVNQTLHKSSEDISLNKKQMLYIVHKNEFSIISQQRNRHEINMK